MVYNINEGNLSVYQADPTRYFPTLRIPDHAKLFCSLVDSSNDSRYKSDSKSIIKKIQIPKTITIDIPEQIEQPSVAHASKTERCVRWLNNPESFCGWTGRIILITILFASVFGWIFLGIWGYQSCKMNQNNPQNSLPVDNISPDELRKFHLFQYYSLMHNIVRTRSGGRDNDTMFGRKDEFGRSMGGGIIDSDRFKFLFKDRRVFTPEEFLEKLKDPVFIEQYKALVAEKGLFWIDPITGG